MEIFMLKFLPLCVFFFLVAYANMPIGHFQHFPNYYFVETGTLNGNGVRNAMIGNAFGEYHTLEVSPYLYQEAKKSLRQFPNVLCHIGNSAHVLQTVIKRMNKPITFWLDAHVFPPVEGKQNCFLLEELEAIKSHPIKEHTILIDDIHCCGHDSFDYITLDQLKEKLLEINPNYQFALIDGGDNGEVKEYILAAYIIKANTR